jgi:hypothetical protein
MFCSKRCASAYNRGKSWPAFFRRLLQNSAVQRNKLTVAHLEKLLLKQKGVCALSGVELTKITGQGVVPTNASIDRIKAGGPYTFDNIRLVCNFVNGFKNTMPDKEFKWWCERIVENG